MTEPNDHPDVPVAPPLVFLAATALGVGLNRLVFQPLRPAGWGIGGLVLAVGGLVLIVWAAWTFRRNKTAVQPWKPSRVVVDLGPYAFSRNPIYVGFALGQVGFGIWSNRLAVVLMVIPALIATQVWIVAREEEYLERKFGEGYRAYKARVRRWL